MRPSRFDRLIDLTGDGFLLGAAAGSAFHFAKGLVRSPSGGRLAGAARAVLANAPRVAGSCAAYAAVYCASKSAVAIARRMDNDPWNAVAGGAAAGGLLNARRGAAVAARRAALGASTVGAVLGLIWSITEEQGRRISEREDRMYNLELPRSGEEAPKPQAIAPRSTASRISTVPPSSTSEKGL